MESLNTYIAITFITVLFMVALARIAIHHHTVNKVLTVSDVVELLQDEVKRVTSHGLNGYLIATIVLYLVTLGLIFYDYLSKWPLFIVVIIASLLLVLLASLLIIVQLRFSETIEAINWAKDLQRDCEVHEGFVVQVISNDNKPSQIFVETGDIVESRIKEFVTEDDVSDFYIKWGEPEDRGVIIYSSLNHEGKSVIHYLILDEEDSTFNLLYA